MKEQQRHEELRITVLRALTENKIPLTGLAGEHQGISRFRNIDNDFDDCIYECQTVLSSGSILASTFHHNRETNTWFCEATWLISPITFHHNHKD